MKPRKRGVAEGQVASGINELPSDVLQQPRAVLVMLCQENYFPSKASLAMVRKRAYGQVARDPPCRLGHKRCSLLGIAAKRPFPITPTQLIGFTNACASDSKMSPDKYSITTNSLYNDHF